jgi:hypothetical protein
LNKDKWRRRGRCESIAAAADGFFVRANCKSVIMVPRRASFGCIDLLRFALTLAITTAAMAAHAQTLLNVVHTIAAPTTGVPVEETFSIQTAGNYAITLTDLGAALTPPAPLASVKLAVTNSSDSLVGSVLVGAGTLTLESLPAGAYELHIVGMPGNTPGSGPIGIQVTGPGATQVATFEDTLALPSQALPNGEAVLDSSFSVGSSGNYTVTLSDLQLPQSLTTLTLLIIQQGAAAPVATLAAAGNTTVALTSGVTYDIFAVGAASAAVNAGLFSAVVAPSGGGAIVLGRAVPVGNTILVGSPALAAGNETLSLTDLKYPAALTNVAATLTLNGQAVASLGASGSQAFAATAGTYSLFAVATAATAAPGAGSYAVEVMPTGGAPSFSAARAVVALGSAVQPYSFDSTLSAAGSYTVSGVDFQFPTTLVSFGVAAVQNGALLGTPLATSGQIPISAAAGSISLLVFAQPSTKAGLFGLEVAPSGGGAATFDVTQGVGALFAAQQIAITVARSYSVTTADLGFPASFASFDTIVTTGTQQVGDIFGGGTFDFPATPGTYYINFIAQTTGPDEAGTYALTVAPAPAAPTVTLTVDKPTVTSGSAVDLIWSSENATTCTASGGWSGPEALSGTATSVALTANTTFTLTCIGAGGSKSASVMVIVNPASSSGAGGGGALGAELLALLLGLSSWRVRRAARRSEPPASILL